MPHSGVKVNIKVSRQLFRVLITNTWDRAWTTDISLEEVPFRSVTIFSNTLARSVRRDARENICEMAWYTAGIIFQYSDFDFSTVPTQKVTNAQILEGPWTLSEAVLMKPSIHRKLYEQYLSKQSISFFACCSKGKKWRRIESATTAEWLALESNVFHAYLMIDHVLGYGFVFMPVVRQNVWRRGVRDSNGGYTKWASKLGSTFYAYYSNSSP